MAASAKQFGAFWFDFCYSLAAPLAASFAASAKELGVFLLAFAASFAASANELGAISCPFANRLGGVSTPLVKRLVGVYSDESIDFYCESRNSYKAALR